MLNREVRHSFGLSHFPVGAPVQTISLGFRNELAESDRIFVQLPLGATPLRVSCWISGGTDPSYSQQNWSNFRNDAGGIFLMGLVEEPSEGGNPYSGTLIVDYVVSVLGNTNGVALTDDAFTEPSND